MIGVFAASSAYAQDDSGGLYICTITKPAETSSIDRKGEKYILGASKYFKRIEILYQNAASPDLSCDMIGETFVCNFISISRNVVFDLSTRKLIVPYGFKDDYSESQCEPYTIE